ncbi:hypothetical protein GGR55DRAFT_65463 [Xylaria sp. FL0064]|nr:hypothetical protein GGR55DRAFT_65463 [Xylaria sp. FL0064]
MRPDGHQFLDELPTRIGGKVDRQSLLKRDLNLFQPSTGQDADISPVGEMNGTERASAVANLIQSNIYDHDVGYSDSRGATFSQIKETKLPLGPSYRSKRGACRATLDEVSGALITDSESNIGSKSSVPFRCIEMDAATMPFRSQQSSFLAH